MQHNSGEEDIFQPLTHGHPSSQDTIVGAGRPLGDLDNYRELNETLEDDPWNPLSSEADLTLASVTTLR